MTDTLIVRRVFWRFGGFAVARSVHLVLLPGIVALVTACTSHQHRPDPDTLLTSTDCGFVRGDFVARSDDERALLAQYLFEGDTPIERVSVGMTEGKVSFDGIAVGGERFTIFVRRFACRKSVLTLVLRDEGSMGSLVTEAWDRKLELYSSDENEVSFRFIDTALTFVFLAPFYSSTDKLVVLSRVDADQQ